MPDLDKLYEQIFRIEFENDFKSYDLYDGSTLNFLGLQNFRSIRLLSTYLNKFFPVNLRPVLGIERRRYPQAIACIVEAYFNKPVSFIEEQEIKELSDWLIDQSLIEEYGYHCWNGLGISIAMRGGGVNPQVPGLIGTSAVANSLIARLQKFKEYHVKEVLNSVRKGILENHFTVFNDIPFFRYKPETPKWEFTVNASVFGAALICKICDALEDTVGLEKVKRSVQAINSLQDKDGHWLYTVDLKDNNHKEQIDFHQAYIIKALLEIQSSRLLDINLKEPIEKGMAFQNNVQVTSTGQVFYRYPKKYPANIHSQLYASYVNKVANQELGLETVEEAEKNFNWAVNNLYDKKIGFKFGKYPFKKINISYSRWGNAHALLVLSKVT